MTVLTALTPGAGALVARGRDPELNYIWQTPQVGGKSLRICSVSASYGHAVLEHLTSFRQTGGQICDGESVVRYQSAQRSFAHYLIACKAKHVMGNLLSTSRNKASTISVAVAPTTAANQNPIPTKMPIAAVTHIDAAVVSPLTVRPSLKITPAPRNPMPVIMPCAMRVGSVRIASSVISVIHLF